MPKAITFEKIGEINIYADTWEFGWGNCGKGDNGTKAIGKCYHRLKRICISKTFHKHCSLIDVLSHEVLHAYLPYAKEEVVEQFGKNLAHAERKLAYSFSPRHGG